MTSEQLKEALLFKHERGQKKYSAFSFLNDGKDMNEETREELIDAINYQTYKKLVDYYGAKAIGIWTVEKLNKEYELAIDGLLEDSVEQTFSILSQLKALVLCL